MVLHREEWVGGQRWEQGNNMLASSEEAISEPREMSELKLLCFWLLGLHFYWFLCELLILGPLGFLKSQENSRLSGGRNGHGGWRCGGAAMLSSGVKTKPRLKLVFLEVPGLNELAT